MGRRTGRGQAPAGDRAPGRRARLRRLIGVASVGTALAAALACTVGPGVDTTPPTNLALCEPWSAMGLPMEPLDRVVACDPRHLAVHLPAGASTDRAPDWRLAIRTDGWVEDVDTSAPGLVNVRYRDGDRILDLSLIDDRARTVVVLTAVAQ